MPPEQLGWPALSVITAGAIGWTSPGAQRGRLARRRSQWCQDTVHAHRIMQMATVGDAYGVLANTSTHVTRQEVLS